MKYQEYIDAVADRADVTFEEAELLSYATLQTLGERISAGEARDLAAQLPKGLQEAMSKPEELAEPFGLGEFIRRVSIRAGVDPVLAGDAVRATLTTLREAVTDGEFDDILAQLPKEYRAVIEPAPVAMGEQM